MCKEPGFISILLVLLDVGGSSVRLSPHHARIQRTRPLRPKRCTTHLLAGLRAEEERKKRKKRRKTGKQDESLKRQEAQTRKMIEGRTATKPKWAHAEAATVLAFFSPVITGEVTDIKKHARAFLEGSACFKEIAINSETDYTGCY